MGLRKYILFSIVFILAVGVYVFSLEGGNYSLSIYGRSISLPVAVWIVVPTVALFLATVLHIMFYGLREYMAVRALKKDYDNFIEMLKKRIVGEQSDVELKTKWFRLPSKIINSMKFDPESKVVLSEDDEINSILEVVRKIEVGEPVDLKKYKLSLSNPIFLKNMQNRLRSDNRFAEDILKKCSDKNDLLCKEAFKTYIRYASLANIKKYDYDIDKEIFEIMVERYKAEKDELVMEVEDIIDYAQRVNLVSEEYIKLAKSVKDKMNPDGLLFMFEKLYEKDENAVEAYLYILFELQMIDQVREILENSAEDELQKYKYLIFLKDSGKNFNIEIFV